MKIKDYSVLDKITEDRTILASETQSDLMKKGIFKFAASGVGSKVKIGDDKYYEYLLALNSENVDEFLSYTINIVSTILTNKIRESRFKNSSFTLLADVDKAKQLQKSILPEHSYEFFDYEIFGLTLPAETLGGDFFDYLNIGDDGEKLGIAVGDAASKGISAAAEAMYISGALRMASTFEIKINSMMKQLNQLINKIFSDDRFCSLFYCELANSKNGLCMYSNAGHNPPIFFHSSSRRIEYLETTGPLLGPAKHSKIVTESINFKNNDVLVIYSDGVTDAANNKYVFYEEKRLEKVIKKAYQKASKEIAYEIIEDVIKFSTSESKYQDDKTVVVIKRKTK